MALNFPHFIAAIATTRNANRDVIKLKPIAVDDVSHSDGTNEASSLSFWIRSCPADYMSCRRDSKQLQVMSDVDEIWAVNLLCMVIIA